MEPYKPCTDYLQLPRPSFLQVTCSFYIGPDNRNLPKTWSMALNSFVGPAVRLHVVFAQNRRTSRRGLERTSGTQKGNDTKGNSDFERRSSDFALKVALFRFEALGPWVLL